MQLVDTFLPISHIHINILKKCLEFKIVNKNNWQNLFSSTIKKICDRF